MPGIAPAKLEAKLPGGDVQLVMHNNKVMRLEFVPGEQRLHALTAQVHECLRLGRKP